MIDRRRAIVAALPLHFECRHLATQRFPGDRPAGAIDVVFARVVRIHVDDGVVGADGKLDIARIRPIARMGYYDYAVVDEVFEMVIPGATPEELDGLAGRAPADG
ncbi:MAG: hypothetical protein GY791_00600 [Alphaproteobacteria bacterium]|nr:hypothetical protein [Alphaproteobacteria bacterium]